MNKLHRDIGIKPMKDWLDGKDPPHGVSESVRSHIRKIQQGKKKTVSLDVVDRILLAFGEPPTTLHELYPLE